LLYDNILVGRSSETRSLIVKSEILGFLKDGKPHGQREIRKEKKLSPNAVNHDLQQFLRDGKVETVMIGKYTKYRITPHGLRELELLTEMIVKAGKEKKSRLRKKQVSVCVVPTIEDPGQPPVKGPPVQVIIGTSQGTPSIFALETTEMIAKLMEPVSRASLETQNFTRGNYLEIRCVIGSPSPQDAPEESDEPAGA
jgi:hypothetical protein